MRVALLDTDGRLGAYRRTCTLYASFNVEFGCQEAPLFVSGSARAWGHALCLVGWLQPLAVLTGLLSSAAHPEFENRRDTQEGTVTPSLPPSAGLTYIST